MKFGIAYPTHPGIVPNVEQAEQLGYDGVHLYDTPLVFSEVCVVAGMVAARTEQIGISISVAVPFLRLPHVLASAVGTLNEAAPGRVMLGFGTGFTAALTTGSPADSWATVRETIRICRGILANEETEAVIEGEPRTINMSALILVTSTSTTPFGFASALPGRRVSASSPKSPTGSSLCLPVSTQPRRPCRRRSRSSRHTRRSWAETDCR